MGPSTQPNNRRDPEGDGLRAAKEAFVKDLERRGIAVTVGLGVTDDGRPAIAVRISSQLRLTNIQLLDLLATEAFRGYPVSVKQVGNLSP